MVKKTARLDASSSAGSGDVEQLAGASPRLAPPPVPTRQLVWELSRTFREWSIVANVNLSILHAEIDELKALLGTTRTRQ